MAFVPTADTRVSFKGFPTLAPHKGPMGGSTNWISPLVKAGVALLFANEIRGLVLAGPVFYGMYATGGTLMAMWTAVCSLAGIALSIIGPLFVAKKLKLV